MAEPATTIRVDLDDRSAVVGAVLGAAVVIVVTVVAAGMTGMDAPSAAGVFFFALLSAVPLVVPWAAAAFGLGLALRGLLARAAPITVAIGLGAAAQTSLDHLAGRLGLVDEIGAWLVLGPGLICLVIRTARAARGDAVVIRLPDWRWTLGAAGAGTLFVAATSAPGWLWTTEFGGYDALAYHLQLPRAWLAAGSVRGLDTNVYAFLPSFVESSFLGLFARTPDPDDAAVACQLLHATMALAGAVVTARFVTDMADRATGALAGVIVLGTPWVVVTGSMAYDEAAVTLGLATALLLLRTTSPGPRRAIALGLIVGAACGAKASAVGLVALPILILALGAPSRRRALLDAGLVGLIAVVVLAPWLVATLRQTGNPIFPFATGLFGAGHWSAEQAANWSAGHRFSGSLAERMSAGVDQWLRFGLGTAPNGDPWIPQWGLIPVAALVATPVALWRSRTRSSALGLVVVLIVQLAFWLALTHVKSRFIVPAVVPMAALVAVGVHALAARPVGRLVATGLIGVHALLPLLLFARERDGRPAAAIGAGFVFRGEGLAPDDAPTAPLTWWVNEHLDAPRVLGVGAAAGFYFDIERLDTVSVWDRGPFSAAVHTVPDDGAVLRSAGYTHVLIDEVMLDVWARAGWGDEALTPSSVRQWLERSGARRIAEDPSRGQTLWALE